MRYFVYEYEAKDVKLSEVSQDDVRDYISDFKREQSIVEASVLKEYSKLNPQEKELNQFFKENELLNLIHQDSERDILFVK